MSEASFASLNPALLARKGGAKPAMRPQLAPLPQDPAAMAALADEQLEDLGWNDMGQDNEMPALPDGVGSADIVSIVSKAANESITVPKRPAIRRQQNELSERLSEHAPAQAEPSKIDEQIVKSAKIAKRARQAAKPAVAPSKCSKRAAFTLRLDTERHLKLRLASTMRGISAQALVTEALDTMLEQFEELDALAARMSLNNGAVPLK
ncbi:hypothetical protein [Erythrobacter sp. MTPC3]|uniref:hypothetical protein n=1 Tax=Erythrobacter sp. MTPC3 TaxID=3056564 RepID=UPI0036F1DD2F